MNICCWLWKITWEFRKVIGRVHIGRFFSQWNENKYRCYTEERAMVSYTACLLYDTRVRISGNKLGSFSSRFLHTHQDHHTFKSFLLPRAYQWITDIVPIKCKNSSTDACNLALTFFHGVHLAVCFLVRIGDKCSPGWHIKWQRT